MDTYRRRTELAGYFPDNDKAILDRWTLGHLGVGAIMRLVGVPRYAAYILAIGFEIGENALKSAFPQVFHATTTHDNLPHAIVDAIVTVSGWEVANALPPERQDYDPATGRYRTLGP